jgi:hypothetical protein
MTIHNVPLDKGTGNRDTAKGGINGKTGKHHITGVSEKVWGRERLP